VIPGGALADARLADVGAAVEFVREQYRHCKTLLVLGAPSSSKLLDAAGISLAEADVASDPGLIQVDAGVGDAAAVDADDGEVAHTLDALPSEADVRRATQAFLIALGRHKHYERERDPAPV